MMTNIRYPIIKVELTGTDDNAFAIMGAVTRALRRGGLPPSELAEFQAEATSGDYAKLLRTCMSWVTVT